jgi:hypothetical protein
MPTGSAQRSRNGVYSTPKSTECAMDAVALLQKSKYLKTARMPRLNVRLQTSSTRRLRSSSVAPRRSPMT